MVRLFIIMTEALLLILLLTADARALASDTISCIGTACSAAFNYSNEFSSSSDQSTVRTQLDNSALSLNPSIEADTAANQVPLYFLIKNGQYDLTSPNYSFDLTSKNTSNNGRTFVLIGDYFNGLNIDVSGYNGKKGTNASELCATKIQLGLLGNDVFNFFNNRRANNQALSSTKCDSIDAIYAQQSTYSCDSGFTLLSSTNIQDPSVNVTVYKRGMKCTATAPQKTCSTQDKTTLHCAWSANCAQWSCVNGSCSQSGSSIVQVPDIANTVYQNNRIASVGASMCSSFYTPTQAQLLAACPNSEDGKSSVLSLSVAGSFDQAITDTQSTYFFESCSNLANRLGGSWTEISSSYVSYFSPDLSSDGSCSNVLHPLDPQNLSTWFPAGYFRDPIFGTEVTSCSTTSCPGVAEVQSSVKKLVDITPTDGESGTQQGSGYVFVYDAINPTIKYNNGSAGAAGLADIPMISTINVCAKIQDFSTDGDGQYAQSAYVIFKKVDYTSLNIANGGNSGAQPSITADKVVLFKKTDSSLRYFLQKEYGF